MSVDKGNSEYIRPRLEIAPSLWAQHITVTGMAGCGKSTFLTDVIVLMLRNGVSSSEEITDERQ